MDHVTDADLAPRSRTIATVDELVRAVPSADGFAADAARERLDRLAKPIGSLGRLEALAARLAAIAGSSPPPVPQRPALIVCVGDHGVHAAGVTPWPRAITARMAGVIADGRATSSVLARGIGADWVVVDVGAVDAVAPRRRLRAAKVRAGTRDLRVEPAMTAAECEAALRAGAAATRERIHGGADLVAVGDMGIANTTASAALIAVLASSRPVDVTGRGTGIDDPTLATKVEVVDGAVARHRRDVDAGRVEPGPLGVLASLGGLEHAALVGAILAGAAHRVPVLLDGVITDAAALVAVAVQPHVASYLVAGHRSAEPGAAVALAHLGLDALLDLDLRLGEGTGALLAVPLLQQAARVLHDVATLDDLGV